MTGDGPTAGTHKEHTVEMEHYGSAHMNTDEVTGGGTQREAAYTPTGNPPETDKKEAHNTAQNLGAEYPSDETGDGPTTTHQVANGDALHPSTPTNIVIPRSFHTMSDSNAELKREETGRGAASVAETAARLAMGTNNSGYGD